MKTLFLFLIFFIPASLLAQTEVDKKDVVMNDQAKEWMNKISSDSGMRSEMMDMMIEKTKDNKEEMTKLVNSITGNAELKRMIMETRSQNATNEYSLQPRGITGDSVKVMKMESVKPAPKK